ncbi:cytochrome b5 domain-containing protein [Dehalobacterium formicoaceticum]|uniref:Cytochrome B5 n=1 Tax=Dehalobacterium formicoaceticum TaxID=51515 RepID=A0ABT1Y9I5_9FIRM|nr:cytochrome b5 domain-containing protein [Dehalobacterium formicoaceticum]MCR6546594.1 cytochrome B5 [Dehalobacterium formicoaceticum]
MREGDFLGQNLDRIIGEIYYDITLLYAAPCVYSRNLILDHLRDRILKLEAVIKATPEAEPPTPLIPTSAGNQSTFTLPELSQYDGKDGNPAYIGVNGIVYDVTNNATWAAATHFGLTAGNDLTNEFATCHGGQPILSKLKVVGKLV